MVSSFFTPVIAAFSIVVAAVGLRAPEDIVRETSATVLARVVELRGTYPDNPGLLEDELVRLLEPVIDFEAFARGVMARSYDAATPTQQEQFRTAFRATLAQLYTRALVTSEIQGIEILETVYGGEDRASVVTTVSTKDGSEFLVQYTMRRDPDGQWRARNLIIDGVNVGLTYRNQFASALEADDGDLSAVIARWPTLVAQQ